MRVNLVYQIERLEMRFIKAALDHTCGNKHRAAKLLTISRRGLYSRMERLGLADELVKRKART